jgi:hypothetical protein
MRIHARATSMLAAVAVTLSLLPMLPGGADQLASAAEAAEASTLVVDHPSGGPVPCTLAFGDVVPGSTHAEAICRLTESGIVKGLDAVTYGPSRPVTRAQMASFLARALDLTPRDGTTFPDVDPTSVHARSIAAIGEAGITIGRRDGTYGPNEVVSRGQLASFLTRALDLPASDLTFRDTSGTTHGRSIGAVTAAGIARGYPDGTYRPAVPVTRAQMASFLARALDLL